MPWSYKNARGQTIAMQIFIPSCEWNIFFQNVLAHLMAHVFWRNVVLESILIILPWSIIVKSSVQNRF